MDVQEPHRFLRRNALIGFCVGFAIGLLALPFLANAGFALSAAFVIGMCLVAAVLSLMVVVTGELLSVKIPIIGRFSKFAIVGGLSTFIELCILNILFSVTGVTAGIMYALFKSLTFCLGVTNSYLWNKYWSFASFEGDVPKEFGGFLFVNLIGIAINVGTASFIVNVIPAPFGLSGVLWGNIGALVAVGVTMVWNFTMYHLIIFKKHG